MLIATDFHFFGSKNHLTTISASGFYLPLFKTSCPEALFKIDLAIS
jgi:hypothetical protein